MHLTEKTLKDKLNIIFPGIEFIHNRQVPDSGLKTRPDYRNDELMLIVEFDGFTHYQKSEVQIRDVKKDRVYSNMGYKIIRIPYFVQLDNLTIDYFFGKNIKIENDYPHGFISPVCLLPADFNAKGIYLFNSILDNLNNNGCNKITEDIKASLICKKKLYIEKGFSEYEAHQIVYPE